MATPRAAEHQDIEQRLRDMERQLRDLTTMGLRRQPIRTSVAQYDSPSFDLPTGWAEVASARQDIVVPEGYTRASVLVFVSAGASFTGAGNGLVGVQPLVAGVSGPAISNGTPGAGAVSVSSFMARDLANLDALPDSVISLRLRAYATGSGTVMANTGNVHLSATVTFLR